MLRKARFEQMRFATQPHSNPRLYNRCEGAFVQNSRSMAAPLSLACRFFAKLYAITIFFKQGRVQDIWAIPTPTALCSTIVG